MKKLIVAMGLIGGLFFLSGKSYAGLPLDQLRTSRTSYIVPNGTTPPSPVNYPVAPTWNTSLIGSSAPTSGAAATVTFAATQTTMTFTNGITNSTFTARNCVTDILVQLSNNSTFYMLDGATTGYVLYGTDAIAFSGATNATFAKHWDHLGPWCGTAGNAVTLSIPAPAVATINNAVSAEGYSVITGLAAIYNINQ